MGNPLHRWCLEKATMNFSRSAKFKAAVPGYRRGLTRVSMHHDDEWSVCWGVLRNVKKYASFKTAKSIVMVSLNGSGGRGPTWIGRVGRIAFSSPHQSEPHKTEECDCVFHEIARCMSEFETGPLTRMFRLGFTMSIMPREIHSKRY